jgi:hypothetical protein
LPVDVLAVFFKQSFLLTNFSMKGGIYEKYFMDNGIFVAACGMLDNG